VTAKKKPTVGKGITARAGKSAYPTAGLTERVVEAGIEKVLPGVLDRVLTKKLEGPPYHIDVLSSFCKDNEHTIAFVIANHSRSGLYLETFELVRPDDKKATVQFGATETGPTGLPVKIEPRILLNEFPSALLSHETKFHFTVRFSRKDQNELQNDPHGILRLRLSPLNEKKPVPVDVPFIIRWRS
jgi:hypothetical protein